MFYCAIILAVVTVVNAKYPNELVLQDPEKVGEVVKNKHPYKSIQNLPQQLDYRELGLLTEDLNQHIPICKSI